MSLSAANVVLMIAVPPLFLTPQQIQGFAPDDVYDIPQIKSVEVMMGVDGILSSGFVYVPMPMEITLQGDSQSNSLFDVWWTQMQAAKDTYIASGILSIPTIGTKYILTNGSLTGYKPVPGAKKLLQPRKHEVTWGGIAPAPV